MSDGYTQKCQVGLPPWVMTFADLMSLLLAFFVLLFSFSEVDKNVYKELAGSLKQAFGVQREFKVTATPKGINIIAREFSTGMTSPILNDEIRQQTTDEYHRYPVFTDPSEKGQESKNKKPDVAAGESHKAGIDEQKEKNKFDAEKSSAEEEKIDQQDKQYRERKLSDLAEKTKEQAKSMPPVADISKNIKEQDRAGSMENQSSAISKALEKEIVNGLIDLDVRKNRIVLRIREQGSFPSGSADLIEPFKAIIERISQVVSDFNGLIIVSGHTDNIPIHTDRFRSNWELSSSRAVSVIHELSKNKLLSKKRFQLAAYADTQPVDTNDTMTGRAKNRRVEITLDYSNATDDVLKAASDKLNDEASSEHSKDINLSNPVSTMEDGTQ